MVAADDEKQSLAEALVQAQLVVDKGYFEARRRLIGSVLVVDSRGGGLSRLR
jgi:hypothetical protein